MGQADVGFLLEELARSGCHIRLQHTKGSSRWECLAGNLTFRWYIGATPTEAVRAAYEAVTVDLAQKQQRSTDS